MGKMYRGSIRTSSTRRRITMAVVIFLCLLLLINTAHSFYIPSVLPRDFPKGSILSVKVNKLSSTKTQLPYEYYYLEYCKPEKITSSVENLGDVLLGDRIENSVYNFKMMEDESCKIACKVKLNWEAFQNFQKMIEDEYSVNMILDNLPVAVRRQTRDGNQRTFYERGFPVGFKGHFGKTKQEAYFINNHLSFRVMYHKNHGSSKSAQIVGFEVTPSSIDHEYEEYAGDNTLLTTCGKNTTTLSEESTVPQHVDVGNEIVFTYDVTFKESEIIWISRWDTYLGMNDNQIHWYSVTNSVVCLLILSSVLALLMIRALKRDIENYNQLQTDEGGHEVTGWKLVRGYVFREPEKPTLLCILVGMGVQMFGMTLVTLTFALLGFLSPANRGGLMTTMVFFWDLMGMFAGYSSVRLHKMFKGENWQKISLTTAFTFPGIVFLVFFILNALVWREQSSGAVPFTTMLTLVGLWSSISAPLAYMGGYVGDRRSVIEAPVRTYRFGREVPEQFWYTKPAFSILVGGILPFGVVYVELSFILTSIWMNQYYYLFGFLFLVFVILLITCAEMSVLFCYFHLCMEDYHWWWRSFLTAGSSALYLFIYSVYFFIKLEITKFVSGALYFGYMIIISFGFFVLTGTIGFYACLWFVGKIYCSLKSD